LLALAPVALAQEPPRVVEGGPKTAEDGDRLEAVKLFAEARAHERRREYASAVRLLERARQLDPRSAEVCKELVPLYLLLERVDDALECSRGAAELAPDDHPARYLYARQLRRHERNDEAIKVLAELAGAVDSQANPDLFVDVLMDLGSLYQQAGRWAEGAEACRRAGEFLTDPKKTENSNYLKEELQFLAASAHEKAGDMYREARQPDDAVRAWEKARREDPSRAREIARRLTELHLERKDFVKANLAADDLLRADPDNVKNYELKLQALRGSGLAGLVIPYLEKAVQDRPADHDLRLLLAREYQGAGRVAQAERVYNQLSQERATPEALEGLLAIYKLDRGQAGERTLDLLERATAAAKQDADQDGPDQPATREQLQAAARARSLLIVLREDPALVAQVLGAARQRLAFGQDLSSSVRFYLGGLAFRTGKMAEAEDMFRSCLEQGSLPRKTEADVYMGLLRVLSLRHKHREIVEVCKKGLERAEATNRVVFHLEMAEALAALGEMTEALRAAEDAVAEAGEPNRLLARRSRLLLWAQAGKKEEAVAEGQALLREYTKTDEVRDVRYTLSGVYSALKDYARSEGHLRAILREDPEDATACNDLGYILAEQGKDLDEAEQFIRRAIRLDRRQRGQGSFVGLDSDQDNAAYVDSLGWVLFRKGRFDEARRELRRAVALPGGKDDPVLWDHLGDVYYRLNQPADARDAWQKALHLFDAGRRRHEVGRYRNLQEKMKLVEEMGRRGDGEMGR
jgi:tetratricopeptide (TPR) repeat protein